MFGLNADELARITLRRDYVDIAGTHHLSFVQYVGGVPVFGNGLQANVAKNGRLINVVGSPVAALPSTAATPSISASQARTRAAEDVQAKARQATASAPTGARRSTTFSNGDRADLVYFKTLGASRLAWQTITSPASGDMYLHIVDAATGRVLYRRDLVQRRQRPGLGLLPRRATSAARRSRGPCQACLTGRRTLEWQPRPRLQRRQRRQRRPADRGDHAHQEEAVRLPLPELQLHRRAVLGRVHLLVGLPTRRTPGRPTARRTVSRSTTTSASSTTTSRPRRSASPARQATSRRSTAMPFRQTPTTARTSRTGCRTATTSTTRTWGHRPTASRRGCRCTCSATRATPPTRSSPSNGGDEADVIYHEYTHGLSNRLVVDALGNSTLGNVQAGSMGEAWSDWYAMDFLNNLGFQPDTAADGEVRIGDYVGHGQDLIRTQPMDCPVESTSRACHGTAGRGQRRLHLRRLRPDHRRS